MSSSTEYHSRIEPVVRDAGLEIYDLELPVGGSRAIRVFVWKGPEVQKRNLAVTAGDGTQVERSGVNLDECAMVSRKIEAALEEAGLFADDMTLEVSSPGVNRKLSKPVHFEGAVGERLKIKVGGESAKSLQTAKSEGAGAEKRNVTVHGKLLSVDAQGVSLACEESRKNVSFAFCDVREARVDFDFGKGR